MLPDELVAARTTAINRMSETLRKVEPTNFPPLLAQILGLFVFISSLVSNGVWLTWTLVKMWVRLAFAAFMAPFVVLYMWVDTVVIIWWFINKFVERITQK